MVYLFRVQIMADEMLTFKCGFITKSQNQYCQEDYAPERWWEHMKTCHFRCYQTRKWLSFGPDSEDANAHKQSCGECKGIHPQSVSNKNILAMLL